jgi:hypothetical protein
MGEMTRRESATRLVGCPAAQLPPYVRVGAYIDHTGLDALSNQYVWSRYGARDGAV